MSRKSLFFVTFVFCFSVIFSFAAKVSAGTDSVMVEVDAGERERLEKARLEDELRALEEERLRQEREAQEIEDALAKKEVETSLDDIYAKAGDIRDKEIDKANLAYQNSKDDGAESKGPVKAGTPWWGWFLRVVFFPFWIIKKVIAG